MLGISLTCQQANFNKIYLYDMRLFARDLEDLYRQSHLDKSKIYVHFFTTDAKQCDTTRLENPFPYFLKIGFTQESAEQLKAMCEEMLVRKNRNMIGEVKRKFSFGI